MVYLIAPFVGWVVAGSLKFVINSARMRGPAWRQIGYGGMPSTHTSIMTTTIVLVGLGEGWTSPSVAVAAAVGIIVILDAMSLRRQVGAHARALNSLMSAVPAHAALRERVGHRWTEVLGGVVVGSACAFVVHLVWS